MLNDSINRFRGVLCYPLASMEMFWNDDIEEYIQEVKKKEQKIKELLNIKRTLQGKLITYIRKSYPIYSYDEIYLYLEKCYLYDAENYDSAFTLYLKTMKKMADTLISHRDGRIVFKYWENKEDKHLFGGFAGSNKVVLFHHLNCHIPMDVIAIVYMITNQQKSDSKCLNYFYGNIEVADQQLSKLLEKGVAENHLHKGVSRTFPSIWNSLMEPLTVKKGNALKGKSFLNGTKEENKHMLFYLLACGIVRGILICWMSGEAVFEKGGKEEGNELHQLMDSFQKGNVIEKFYKEEFEDKEDRDIISYYLNLWEILENNLPDGAYTQPFCRFVLGESDSIHTFDENIFLYHILERMYEKRLPLCLRKCVIQYLRIRNYFFHVTVQQKTIKGLDYFQQAHYSVNSVLNKINVHDFWENAIREQLQNQNLHKIEFRTGMREKEKELRKEVKHFLQAYKKILEEDYCFFDGERYIPKQKFPQVGLVLHFLKKSDRPMQKKCILDGEENCAYYRFGELQKTYQDQIDSFVKIRLQFHELTKYLVGIDAASLENSTPVWVFAPIYEQARDSRIEPIGWDSERGQTMQSLGFTFHAGEDFRHILSGLRRIDEAVEHLKFHAGDRIGHGIALGISPQLWKRQNPVIIIPQMEALENYLWAYDLLRRNYSDFQASVLAYMEHRIYELSQNIYGKTAGIDLEMLISSYYLMFSDAMVKDESVKNIDLHFCCKLNNGEPVNWDAKRLVAARHCNVFVKKMEQPIHYEITEQDLFIIEALQQMLKKKLGREGIVIEVNPSSNTTIADLDNFRENQFYQMNKANDGQNLIICINSDDPAVFNTNVSNELAYIYYGMLEQNINREAALLWIDQIRKNGLESSFIRHQESDEILLKNLSDLIEHM